jgi:hypothetical protein
MQQRGFAGAGRAHECQKFPGMNVERDMIQRGDFDFTLTVELGKVADGNHGRLVHPLGNKWN